MNKEVTVYEPNQRLKIGFFETWVIMFKNIVKSKELIIQLFKRDFFMSYKKSYLGLAWILISPLVGIVSWVFLNSAGILQPGDTPIPFPAYVLLGSSIWGLFMGFYGSAGGTLGAGAGFINQVKYPHEALLIKQTAQHIANFLITFVVNIIVLLLFGVTPSLGILLFPLTAIPLFFLGAGLGLIVSVLSVVASDLTNVINIIMGFVFYAIPIVYQIDKIENPLLQTVVQINPLTYLVTGARDIIVEGTIHYPERYLLVAAISFVFFMLSWRLFYVSEDKVIERMI
ncbi:ABC transporter permease [Candidatus Dojkabacteria bacterium]|jgi:lipopolysaccharide transport system permease protein|nr:ABC transporter permease [Candidatus Dojkabacteria bacterium]